LDPILALALKPDPDGKSQCPQLLGKIIAVFAVDPTQIGLAGDIGNLDAVL